MDLEMIWERVLEIVVDMVLEMVSEMVSERVSDMVSDMVLDMVLEGLSKICWHRVFWRNGRRRDSGARLICRPVWHAAWAC
jgi:hypothetical protein